MSRLAYFIYKNVANSENSHAIITDMEPKSPGQFEQAPVGQEYQPVAPTPEQPIPGGERIGERPRVERESSVPQAIPVPMQPSVQLPTPVAPDNTTTGNHSASDDIAIAADEDLIEKEWVDKAKQVIAQTRDDPYRQEREVSKLQADYLMKRYGKTLGRTDQE